MEGWGRRRLQREERRHRLRQGERGGTEARGTHQEAQRLDEAARIRQGQAPEHRQGLVPRHTQHPVGGLSSPPTVRSVDRRDGLRVSA